MNILFLTIGRMESIEAHGIYPDLLRQFRDNGHSVYVVSQREKRTGLSTELVNENGVSMLFVRIGNITKCNFLEKGISTIKIERQYLKAINKYFQNICFDFVMYSTPPITLCGVVEYIKKRDNAITYLLLKDIFPQNAVDIGILSKKGITGILYKYFRFKEKRLYSVSDWIGCMSPANVEYVLKNNPEIEKSKLHVSPNCIEPCVSSLSEEEKIAIRFKYKIPVSKKVFVYGGNFGKPQGISFVIDCLRSQKDNNECYFLLVGDGTEYVKLMKFIQTESQKNVKLLKRLPKEDFDHMIAACDVGLIFLDHKFTIPNFPSRLLSYMQAGLPVLACTDTNTDVGQVITEGGFGWWCESNDVDEFDKLIHIISKKETGLMSEKAVKYLNDNYTTEKVYASIIKKINVCKQRGCLYKQY